MKSVLISIRPEWVEKIASGKKTIEVRKTAPKESPFKAYIYETKGKKIECGFHFEDTGITLREKYVFGMHKARIIKHYRDEGRGKVIGEFICDKVYNLVNAFGGIMFADENLNQLEPQLFRDMSCLTDEQTADYLGDKDGYGWHISDLKIYDKPKKLSEFKISCNRKNLCYSCNRFTGKPWDICNSTITRPPQSYMFVEEVKE
nr:MAG TPA: The ASCH domain adopts a beta-barrel fold similar to that of the PUA domain [Bacteriophage sp.]